MAQQGAALQTYNLELIKGGCENAIEDKILICANDFWKKPAQKMVFIFFVYSTVEHSVFRFRDDDTIFEVIESHLRPLMVDEFHEIAEEMVWSSWVSEEPLLTKYRYFNFLHMNQSVLTYWETEDAQSETLNSQGSVYEDYCLGIWCVFWWHVTNVLEEKTVSFRAEE